MEDPEDSVAELHRSVREDDSEALERILRTGVDPDEPDWNRKGRTPLFEAALRGNGKHVQILLRVGADPNAKTAQGETVLHVVLQNHPLQTEVVHQLLACPDLALNVQENLSGLTVLHILAKLCVSNGNAFNLRLHEALEEVASRCDVNIRSHKNETPLHRASSGNRDNVKVVDVLLKFGADPNVRNDRGLTSLLCAIDKGHPVIASLLISKESDLKLTDRYGQTALHYAAQRGSGDLVSLMLSRNGCDVNATDANRDTALHLAASKGYIGVVHSLLSHPDTDGDRRNGRGKTPLHNGIESGFAKVVRALLRGKCDLHARTGEEKTALEVADEVRGRGTHAEIRGLILAALHERRASWDKLGETCL